MSGNKRAWWDNSRARELGYAPVGRAEDHVDHAMAAQRKIAPDQVADAFQGGAFCASELSFALQKSGVSSGHFIFVRVHDIAM